MYGEEIKGFKTFKYDRSFEMKLGGAVEAMEIVYETWGELNEEKDNAILLHTGLSASSHAKSHEVSLCHLSLSHAPGHNVCLQHRHYHCHLSALSLNSLSCIKKVPSSLHYL